MAKGKRVAILALGLIGGSLAMALKKSGYASEVVAWGPREASLKKGLELGVIDRYSLDMAEAIAGADIIVVATPTRIAETVLQQLASLASADSIITDVASVKGNLLTAAKKAFGQVPANLVLGHPIAGSEKSGVAAAKADLFVKHRVILTPTEETSSSALQTITEMWQATGAELSTMPVADHDEVLAATSHLPHLLAYALVDALAGQQEQQDIFRFAAGGFRDFTRIASSDPTMWQEIALANRAAILKMLDLFSGQLHDLRTAIDEGDGEAIMASFRRAKTARDNFADMLARQNQATTSQE
jgi:prephenate dehydrogenase